MQVQKIECSVIRRLIDEIEKDQLKGEEKRDLGQANDSKHDIHSLLAQRIHILSHVQNQECNRVDHPIDH